MTKKELEYNKIKWAIEDLLFKQEHKELITEDKVKLEGLKNLLSNYFKAEA